MSELRRGDFPAVERFGDAALGVIALGDRLCTLAAIPRADGQSAADGALASFFLGVISAARTMRAQLAVDAVQAAGGGDGATGAPSSQGPGLPPGILR